MIELLPGKDGLEIALPEGKMVLKRDLGYSPVELTVVAVSACATYVLESILDKQHVTYEILKTTMTYERNEEKRANPIKSIDITFEVRADESAHAKIQKATRLIAGNCPVIQTLDEEVEVIEEIVFVD